MKRLAIALLLAEFIVLGLLTAAFAHGWYPWDCCSDHDCRRVNCEEIIETSTGFEFDGVTFAKSAERPSQDQWCHVCIIGEGDARRGLCLFTQMGT